MKKRPIVISTVTERMNKPISVISTVAERMRKLKSVLSTVTERMEEKAFVLSTAVERMGKRSTVFSTAVLVISTAVIVISTAVEKLKYCLLLTITLLATSCGVNTFDSDEDMWSYLREEDNGYVQKRSVNGIDYNIVYRPTDLLVNQTLTEYSEKAVDSLRKHYSQYLYFNISFSKNNQELLSTVPKNRQHFGAMVNQLVFGMSDYVYAYNNKHDTLQMVDYIYPRLYGVSNGTKMMFVYEANEEELKEENLFIEIKDMGMQTGDIKFKFPTKNIKKQPQLLFQAQQGNSK